MDEARGGGGGRSPGRLLIRPALRIDQSVNKKDAPTLLIGILCAKESSPLKVALIFAKEGHHGGARYLPELHIDELKMEWQSSNSSGQ
jgi:hypothetical protein